MSDSALIGLEFCHPGFGVIGAQLWENAFFGTATLFNVQSLNITLVGFERTWQPVFPAWRVAGG